MFTVLVVRVLVLAPVPAQSLAVVLLVGLMALVRNLTGRDNPRRAPWPRTLALHIDVHRRHRGRSYAY